VCAYVISLRTRETQVLLRGLGRESGEIAATCARVREYRPDERTSYVLILSSRSSALPEIIPSGRSTAITRPGATRDYQRGAVEGERRVCACVRGIRVDSGAIRIEAGERVDGAGCRGRNNDLPATSEFRTLNSPRPQALEREEVSRPVARVIRGRPMVPSDAT